MFLHRQGTCSPPFGEGVLRQASPDQAVDGAGGSGHHDHSQHDGRWDDLQQSRKKLEVDAGVGGAKQRPETSDPANVSTIDEWGDEGPCNHPENDDLSHLPPWELSDYGSSLTLRFAGADPG